jgi:hypothetical protein
MLWRRRRQRIRGTLRRSPKPYYAPDVLMDGLPDDEPSLFDFLEDLPDWSCGGGYPGG